MEKIKPINQHKSTNNLKYAITLALASPMVSAATFNVTEPQDDGTGLVANSLSWAILQANTNAGADTIELNTDVTITGVMKRLIDSDTTLESDDTRRTIDGNNQYRPLFIKSGQVTINDLDLQNGRAQGGSSGRGGSGAGMGGSLFIYDGDISVSNVSISSSIAIGGGEIGGGGGGAIFGNGGDGGGGLFENAAGSNGGYGGYGNYQTTEPNFGQGGNFSYYYDASHGGFGAGGGFSYYGNAGHGGFGAGGGYSPYEVAGHGGFGAGGGETFSGVSGVPGFGGNESFAAGLGGAVFVREGSLRLEEVNFENNQSLRSGTVTIFSEGYGGALFVMHSTQNSNSNNQGMPNTLPTVTGCGVVFTNNQADNDPAEPNNNDDYFDLGNRIVPDSGVVLTDPCGPPDQEIQISGNGIEIIDGDVTPELADGTDMGAEVAGFNQTFQTFTIENLGNHAIQLTGNPLVSLTNNNNSQFEIIQQPVSNVVLGGQSVEFQIMFNPSFIGIDTATVVIESNDVDENPYEFQIQGNGLPAEAEMDVKGENIEIADGDISPDVNDNTDFGVSMIGFGSVTKTFTIENSGYDLLLLTGSPIVSLQNNNGQFNVSAQPQSGFIEPGIPVTFDITFTAVSEGIDSATVVIENTDSDENPYDFVIQAEAIEPPPEIDLYGDTFVAIADGDVTPSIDDGTYFGEAQENGQSITRTFFIDNSFGFGDLILNGSPVVELQNNSGQFTVSSQPSMTTIPVGNFVAFEVTFTPNSTGTDTATVVIQNNDPDEAPYDFVIEAEGIPQAPILQVLWNGIEIQNGDNSPSEADGTFFGYTPVTGGQIERTFELKNIGFADLALSEVTLLQQSNHFSLVTNIDKPVLAPGESTNFTVMLDPVVSGFSELALFEVKDNLLNVIHYNFIDGYGQPTVTINSINNYLQEGEVASFLIVSDVQPSDYIPITWQVSGQVEAEDFGVVLPWGVTYINPFNYVNEFDFISLQDGIYEGPEFFNVNLSSTDPKVHIGFPSISGGVIDDDWIFDDGFEQTNLNQLIIGIAKYAFEFNETPACNLMACNFLNKSMSVNSNQRSVIDILAWFEQTLVVARPMGDWDGDGLPNHQDLNPFGLSQTLLSKISIDDN